MKTLNSLLTVLMLLVSYDPDQHYRVMYALLGADRDGKLDRKALQQSDGRLARALIHLLDRE